jgi:hypothetical protein
LKARQTPVRRSVFNILNIEDGKPARLVQSGAAALLVGWVASALDGRKIDYDIRMGEWVAVWWPLPSATWRPARCWTARRLHRVGKLLPAQRSLAIGGLPLGLAHGIRLVRPVQKGQSLSWDDVAMDTTTRAYALRMELQGMFAQGRRDEPKGLALA